MFTNRCQLDLMTVKPYMVEIGGSIARKGVKVGENNRRERSGGSD